MDSHFQQLLHRAGSIRGECWISGDVGPHAAIMYEMIEYAANNNLESGNLFEGTASEERLAIATEGAAMIVEVSTHTSLGLVHSRTKEDKIALIQLAKEIAELGIVSI